MGDGMLAHWYSSCKSGFENPQVHTNIEKEIGTQDYLFVCHSEPVESAFTFSKEESSY